VETCSLHHSHVDLETADNEIKYVHSSNTFINASTNHPLGYMFRPNRTIIRPHIWTGSFDYSTVWDPKTVYKVVL